MRSRTDSAAWRGLRRPNCFSFRSLHLPLEDPDMATVAPAADRILPSFPHLGWRYFLLICSLSSVLLIDWRSGFCLLSLYISLYLSFIWFDLWVSVGTVRAYEKRGRCLVDDCCRISDFVLKLSENTIQTFS